MPKGKGERAGRKEQTAAVKKAVPFEGMGASVKASRKAPPKVTELTPKLVDRANDELAGGAWPRDLPAMLNVGRHRWEKWVKEGEDDLEKDRDTPAAELAGMLARARACIERALREAIKVLAAAGKDWKAAAWLLARMSPERYNERVEALVEEHLTKLLKALRDADDVTEADFEKVVRALEQARRGG